MIAAITCKKLFPWHAICIHFSASLGRHCLGLPTLPMESIQESWWLPPPWHIHHPLPDLPEGNITSAQADIFTLHLNLPREPSTSCLESRKTGCPQCMYWQQERTLLTSNPREACSQLGTTTCDMGIQAASSQPLQKGCCDRLARKKWMQEAQCYGDVDQEEKTIDENEKQSITDGRTVVFLQLWHGKVAMH